ncbi:MAG: type II toxin-antitoxin system RelE/ParE family toxin [Synergistaceae bacterium]|nr:type II toxin-antitoxin system RelE/ParE family toxin [Synergistaceae bacterium]MBR0034322.1 type II toxin-antitoxin system RelE/ParE family toxin [Synergistaceae bacterium]
MDSSVRGKIYDWINKHLEGCDNPRAYGKALKGNRKGYWRYRVGDYRIIADIQDDKIVIIITDVGHRGDIYKGG